MEVVQFASREKLLKFYATRINSIKPSKRKLDCVGIPKILAKLVLVHQQTHDKPSLLCETTSS